MCQAGGFELDCNMMGGCAVKLLGKCLYAVVTTVLVLILILNLLQIGSKLLLKKNLPRVFGWSQAVVLSGSMEPEFSAGDLIIIHNEEDYQIGDVITFNSDGGLISHRIVKQTGSGYITQGDANNSADGKIVLPEQIYGKVKTVLPGLGRVVLFLKSPTGLLLCLALAVIFIRGPELIRI